jgi:TrmH family RNA methyltransferase
MKKIESTQNKLIKERAKLHLKKQREKDQLFLVEGAHLIEEADKAGILSEVYLSDASLMPDVDCEATLVSEHVLEKLSNQNSKPDLVGVCRFLETESTKDFKRVLLLDKVQDPGNVGTLFRSAYAFQIDLVVLSYDCADPYNLKTLQASQGALFHIPFIKTDLSDFIDNNPSLHYYATALHAKSVDLTQAKKQIPFGIILGNEGQGLPQNILDKADTIVKIEMAAFESLNVAIAGSICMYEFYVSNK